MDGDGDDITISQEVEFQDAADHFKKRQAPFKLVVHGVASAPAVRSSISSPSASPPPTSPPRQQAITPTSVQARPASSSGTPGVDYVSELQICLQGMHRCTPDASKVKYEYGQQPAQAGFRCRVVLTFGKPGDGEYAWSEVRGRKQDAKQDAARLALESLPGMKEGQSPGQGSAGGPTKSHTSKVDAKR